MLGKDECKRKKRDKKLESMGRNCLGQARLRKKKNNSEKGH
jgi:hypothetical protein